MIPDDFGIADYVTMPMAVEVENRAREETRRVRVLYPFVHLRIQSSLVLLVSVCALRF